MTTGSDGSRLLSRWPGVSSKCSMTPLPSAIFGLCLGTGWSRLRGTEKASIVSALTTSIEYVLSGEMGMFMGLKSLITTKEREELWRHN